MELENAFAMDETPLSPSNYFDVDEVKVETRCEHLQGVANEDLVQISALIYVQLPGKCTEIYIDDQQKAVDREPHGYLLCSDCWVTSGQQQQICLEETFAVSPEEFSWMWSSGIPAAAFACSGSRVDTRGRRFDQLRVGVFRGIRNGLNTPQSAKQYRIADLMAFLQMVKQDPDEEVRQGKNQVMQAVVERVRGILCSAISQTLHTVVPSVQNEVFLVGTTKMYLLDDDGEPLLEEVGNLQKQIALKFRNLHQEPPSPMTLLSNNLLNVTLNSPSFSTSPLPQFGIVRATSAPTLEVIPENRKLEHPKDDLVSPKPPKTRTPPCGAPPSPVLKDQHRKDMKMIEEWGPNETKRRKPKQIWAATVIKPALQQWYQRYNHLMTDQERKEASREWYKDCVNPLEAEWRKLHYKPRKKSLKPRKKKLQVPSDDNHEPFQIAVV